MKKTMYIARPVKNFSAAILTSLLLLAGVADVSATNHASDTAINSPAINYVGASNNLLTFNVNYANAEGKKVIIELVDQNGEKLYRRIYSDSVINKNIYLKSAGEKCTVSFNVIIGDETIRQKFDIEPQVKLVQETYVSKL